MGSSQRKARAGVIKRRARPRSGVVALLAGLWEIRLHVIWFCRALEVSQVTRDTRPAAQVVVPVDVTL